MYCKYTVGGWRARLRLMIRDYITSACHLSSKVFLASINFHLNSGGNWFFTLLHKNKKSYFIILMFGNLLSCLFLSLTVYSSWHFHCFPALLAWCTLVKQSTDIFSGECFAFTGLCTGLTGESGQRSKRLAWMVSIERCWCRKTLSGLMASL